MKSSDGLLGISILGAILNRKHYERNRMHVHILDGMSEALTRDLTDGISEINGNRRCSHAELSPIFSKIRLNTLWMCVYFATFIVGCIMILLGLGKI